MSPIRVLVIDDSHFMRTIIQSILAKDERIEVVDTAADGVEGMKKILEHAPDAVTLDIEMPRMNGLDLLSKLTSLDKRPKILMLSSLTSKGAVLTHRALRLGADDFMLKPRDLTAVRQIERELILKITHLVQIPSQISHEAKKPEMARSLVMIGSSAGGPPMLDTLLSSLDPQLPSAVVVTQHMPEGFTAPLAERLNRISLLPVRESCNGDLLEKGTVLISRAGVHSVVTGAVGGGGERGGRLIHSTEPAVHSVRPAVDRTFSSGARVFGKRSVGVLLSGMGRDGGEGSREITQAGGTVLAVAEEDCLVYGMIRAAQERKAIDQVVPLQGLSAEIGRAAVRAEE
jgi:two-component system chemotaxis response regulator CheB